MVSANHLGAFYRYVTANSSSIGVIMDSSGVDDCDKANAFNQFLPRCMPCRLLSVCQTRDL